MYSNIAIGPRNFYFNFIAQKTDPQSIDRFFRGQFQHGILQSVASVPDGESFDIYTHFPYRNQYATKVLQVTPATVRWPSNLFETIFMGKNTDLHNATVKVFLTENLPKVFRVPSYYRSPLPHKFHFVGRDGLVAHIVEQRLHSNWNYHTINESYLAKIAHFMETHGGRSSSHMYENSIDMDADESNLQMLTYVNTSGDEQIS